MITSQQLDEAHTLYYGNVANPHPIGGVQLTPEQIAHSNAVLNVEAKAGFVPLATQLGGGNPGLAEKTSLMAQTETLYNLPGASAYGHSDAVLAQAATHVPAPANTFKISTAHDTTAISAPVSRSSEPVSISSKPISFQTTTPPITAGLQIRPVGGSTLGTGTAGASESLGDKVRRFVHTLIG